VVEFYECLQGVVLLSAFLGLFVWASLLDGLLNKGLSSIWAPYFLALLPLMTERTIGKFFSEYRMIDLARLCEILMALLRLVLVAAQ
jgi:hypothetical protein